MFRRMGTLARRPRNSSRARVPNLHAGAETLSEPRPNGESLKNRG
jgi:hypothetical protein